MPRDGRRDQAKEKFWRRMVRGQAGSGLSVRAWCRRYGLGEPGFYWWRGRLARGDKGSPPQKDRRGMPALVPVRVIESSSSSSSTDGPIEIVLAAGRRIRVFGPVDRQMLADVVAVLEHADEPAKARPC